jgi:transglutaminase-like putative cysteine protease
LRTRIVLLVSCLTGLAPCHAVAAASLHTFAPTPAWVLPSTVDYGVHEPLGQIANGTWQLWLDRQVNVTATGEESYLRYVQKAVNQTGLARMGQINLYVDPRYQVLAIHKLQVVRQDTVLDVASTARFTELPVENELDRLTYRGLYKINIVLADLRVGDLVDVAYSLQSKERFFPGRITARVPLEWSEPLHAQRVRFRYPATRPLRVRFNKPGFTVSPVTSGDFTEFSYVSQDPKPIFEEQGRPYWHELWAVMEVSDVPDWHDVAGKVATLFKLDGRKRPQLEALVAELDKGPPGAEDRISQVLQYVQDNIRYTSIAIDRGAYQPNDPEVVLKRRFGDCKDKALLLATMLQRYGIDATPALVNTSRGRTLPSGLPSPWVFDHVVVRVRVPGSEWWVDPTLYRQQTPLRELAPPDFQQALVVVPETTGLTAIPRPSPQAARVDVNVEFDVRNGQHQPVTMKLELAYYGNRADLKRATFAAQSLEAWQADITPFLERYYPGLRARGSPVLEDDPARNRLSLTAHFEVERAFHAKNERWEFPIYDEWTYSFLEPLRSMARTTPLALSYPAHVHQRTTVLLPSPWTITPSDLKVQNPAFTYFATERYEDFRLELDREFTMLKDSVDVTELAGFQKDLKRVDDDSPLLLWTAVKPVDPAVLSDAKALRKLIRKIDDLGRNDHNVDAAADTMASILAAPAFASLTSEDRHLAHAFDADVGMGLRNWPRTYRSARAATALPEATGLDWEFQVYGAYNTADYVEAGRALAEIGRRWPERLGKNIPDDFIYDVLYELDAEPWFDLADALRRTPWASRVLSFSEVWRRLAAAWVERGDIQRAREVLPLIDDPFKLVELRADRRFAAVFADAASMPGISETMAARLKRLKSAARDEPRSLRILNQWLLQLLNLRNYDEVLDLTEEALESHAEAKAESPAFDDPERVRWIRDYRARALWALDRKDEALQQWSLAVEGDKTAVGQAVNLGVAYCNLDRPHDALLAIEALAPEAISGIFRKMELSEVRLCASLALKDKPSAEIALAYLRETRAESPRLYQRALIWANRLDEAATYLRDRLADPKTRGDALVDVQDYAPAPVFSRSAEFTARWQWVLKQDAVSSAIKAVGSVERYPFGAPPE